MEVVPLASIAHYLKIAFLTLTNWKTGAIVNAISTAAFSQVKWKIGHQKNRKQSKQTQQSRAPFHNYTDNFVITQDGPTNALQ